MIFPEFSLIRFPDSSLPVNVPYSLRLFKRQGTIKTGSIKYICPALSCVFRGDIIPSNLAAIGSSLK